MGGELHEHVYALISLNRQQQKKMFKKTPAINIEQVKEEIKRAATKAILEVCFTRDSLYKIIEPILNKSLEETFEFRGLKIYQSLFFYINDFWQVFRYIFQQNLNKSDLPISKDRKYFPHTTDFMYILTPLDQDKLYNNYF